MNLIARSSNLLLISLLILISHWTSILTYTLVRNIKNGQYIVPLLGWKFENWWPFVLVSVAFLQPFYWTGGVLLFTAYKVSLDRFTEVYPAVILNLAAMIAWTIMMMYFRVRELPTRDGWIALTLIIIASLLAINTGRSIKP